MVARAESELARRYGALDESERGLVPTMFEPPQGAFVVARAAGRALPVGGVGVRSSAPGTGEVKRLWVDPDWRERGVGRALMAALEGAAQRLGFDSLELATGDRQPEAVALYAATGWERRRLDDEGRALPACHLWFTKHLGPDDAGAV